MPAAFVILSEVKNLPAGKVIFFENFLKKICGFEKKSYLCIPVRKRAGFLTPEREA